jgi:hypothetical protein
MLVVARPLRCSARKTPPGVAMTRVLPVLLGSFVFLLATVAAAGADDVIPRLRTTDRRIRALLDDGIAQSPSLRALVARLAGSDVVVYLRCGTLPAGLDAQLTFVSAAGGFRYVVVRLAFALPPQRTIATLGHELQHAVEIADHRDIVDQASLARAYARIGFAHRAGRAVTAFDTQAAIAAGVRIGREIKHSAAADD